MTLKLIHRPVLSIVVAIIILLLGVLALTRLPMAQFPEIAPPKVNVTVEYTGANAETVTKSAIIPLERAINGVPGMKYMSSDSGNDGMGIVQVYFDTDTDPNVAAINVQNRVASVKLPPEVTENGIKITKEISAMLMYLNIYSSDPDLDQKFLYNFADLNVLPELNRISGVGFADIMGAKEYAMRVWLKPDQMLIYGVSADDIMAALENENVEAAPGKLGESSDTKNTQMLQYTLAYTGKFKTEEEYARIPVKASSDGKILHIGDVAEIQFGTSYFDVASKFNGKWSAAIMLKQLPGSNARDVIERVKQRMEELKASSFLPGMDYEVSYDVSRFLDASVHEVIKTLIEAFILVSLVVFLFLQDWRSTLIPALAVPVSLVGTFFILYLIGFSLNMITLFALVLSIGIVVDDSIVVVEAVHAKMELTGKGPRKATEMAMREITGAIIAITLVMSAVFFPVTFMTGPSGVFYRQFALTMATTIILSGITALTLAPALCILILKKPNHREPAQQNAFMRTFNLGYKRLEGRYTRGLEKIISRRVVTFGVLIVFCLGLGLIIREVPSGFIPSEDQGTFYASVTSPPGATLERTKAVVEGIQQSCKDIDAIESISTLAGTNILSDGTGASYGTCLINLKPWDERKEDDATVMAMLQEKTAWIKDAEIEFFPPPAVPGYGNASGFELRLIDKTGQSDQHQMEDVVTQFVRDINERPEVSSAFTIFNASYPQFTLKVDMDKAAQKGVTVNDAMSTLQTLLGSEYATNFVRFGRLYKVMVQALPSYRDSPESLMKLTVSNDEGQSVPLSAFMSIEKTYGSDQVTRYNMFTSAEINGDAAPGYSSGDVLQAIQETARQKLPSGYDIDWAGISRDEVNTGNQGIFIFLICLAFVYLLLAAQYESFLLPFPVILSLPIGIFGAYFFLFVTGLENNIYAQVAAIMLIGLLGKNAILIVEFATLRHRSGASPLQAAIEGAKIRLRPILMTSFAFVAGLVPLMMATGAGANGNRTIGTAAAGGMVFGTVFGVLIIPGLYLVFALLTEHFHREEEEEELNNLTETV